jgi:hypothetical protein
VVIPDGLYDVYFELGTDKTKTGGQVLVEGKRVRLIRRATRLPENRLRLEAWLELDRELLHHSPDKAFWHYAYLGDPDFSMTVDTQQTGISPVPE